MDRDCSRRRRTRLGFADKHLSHWTATVPAGELHQFDFTIFKNSKDVNVQLLVKLLENIGETIKSIVNINALDMDEVEEEDEEDNDNKEEE